MIPIGDSPRARRTPVVTRLLIVANVLVFVWSLLLSDALAGSREEQVGEFVEQTNGICYGFETRPTDVDRFYCRWSFQPQEWFDTVRDESKTPGQSRVLVVLSILTAMFLHAGWLHIIGNMLFLWVFGDNVEDRLGHAGFLLFYLAAGIVASLTQGWIDPESVIPVVGASGAVAGVLGAYLIYYPKAVVTTLIPIAIVLVPFPVPAVIMIGLWFLMNLLSGLATLSPEVSGGDSGVAFFAHIGGFVFGAAVVALFLRHLRPHRPRRGGPPLA